MDFLYTGQMDETNTLGLCYWCGADSEKHDGQLKRICGPVISLLRWLVTYEEDTIFYERFVHLTAEELVKINFPKHILRNSSNLKLNLPGQSRSGSSEDAFELLSILLSDHRNIEDEVDPLNMDYLLCSDKMCMQAFEDWLQTSNTEHIHEALNALKAIPSQNKDSVMVKRPATWGDLTLRYLPLQEGEEVGVAEEDG
ncbi:hypothetical protein EON65_50205, partial [archaeon]